MNFDKSKLLVQRDQARVAMVNQALPADIRKLYKTAFDKSGALLGLQDALGRKVNQPQVPPEVMEAQQQQNSLLANSATPPVDQPDILTPK